MRRVVAVSAALALVFVAAGCLINRYSSDPQARMAQLQATGTVAPGAVSCQPPTALSPPGWASNTSSGGLSPSTSAPGSADPLELRQSLAEKKARLHETRAQFYKLEAQRYAVLKALRDLEAQVAADEKALGAAGKEKRPKRNGPAEKGQGEKAAKPVGRKARQGASPAPPQAVPLSSRFWGAVDRLQSFLGVHAFNVYSSDPNRRVEKLLNNSEDVRQIQDDWESIWRQDQPRHLTPDRVRGGIQ